jgi:probable HAF family extracellular repeat protein
MKHRLGLGMVTSGLGQSLTWLGTYDGYAEVHGVSADGTVVVGWAGVSATHIAFRWTPNTGWQNIGSPTGSDTEAWGLSADGQVIVGVTSIGGGVYRGFRWRNGTFTLFGTFGGPTSWAWAANRDGSVIVGAAELSNGFNRDRGSGLAGLPSYAQVSHDPESDCGDGCEPSKA